MVYIPTYFLGGDDDATSRSLCRLTSAASATCELYAYSLSNLKLCLATATHNFKWVKFTEISLIWDQTFANFDV